MPTINQLSEADTLADGDQLPIFSEAQGDTRKVNFLTLKDSVADEFVSLAALAAQTGAGLVGTADGTDVQQALDAKPDLTDLALSTGAALVGSIAAGTSPSARTVQAKLRDAASVADYDGTLATALTNAPATSPVWNGLGGLYLPNQVIADPGSLLTTSMLPTLTNGRAPLFVINNPGVSDLVAGYAAGLYVHIGDNPTATPALGDTVAITTTVNNLNGRTHLWGSNTVVLQDASGADGKTRAAEFEINNVKGFNADPFSGSAPYRKNCIELVGHNSSTFKLTAALTVWANDTTGTGWFDQGLVLSRVASKGIRFIRNPGGASDTGVAFATSAISDESNSNATLACSGTHGSIIDLSGNPTFSQFILGKGNADTNINVKNSADYGVVFAIDSGTSAAQLSAVDLSDRGTAKWRIAKNNGNDLLVISDPLGSPSTVMTIAPGGGGSVGIGTAPSYKFDVSGSTRLNGNVGFQGTAPIAKPTVTGAKGGNAALTSLIAALASYGLITDSTT